MATFTASRVAAARFWIGTGFRLLGLLALVAAAAKAVRQILSLLVPLIFQGQRIYLPGLLAELAGPAISALAAAVLVRYAYSIARLVVPAPRSVCDGCGYELSGVRAGRCPECGRSTGPSA